MIAGLVLDAAMPTPKELADYAGYGMLTDQSGAVTSDGPQVFHVMSPTFPSGPMHTVLPRRFQDAGTRLVVTLYDLIPLLYPEFYFTHPSVEAFYKSRYRLTSEADHALAISQATKDDAVRLLGMDPERITVIYGAVSDYFVPPDAPLDAVRDAIRDRLPNVTKPFVLSILYTDEFGKRKNLEGAIAGFSLLPEELRRDLQLVLVGHGFDSDFAQLGSLAKELGVNEQVAFTGVVTDDLFRALYQGCELFIFPSVYEGLGLPILEAMQCGAPVITSDRSSTRELVEIKEARFDPFDSTDIARAMNRALTDRGYHQHLREYGIKRSAEFTWERVAQETADCYRELAASAGTRRSWRMPRLRNVAVVMPDTTDGDVAQYVRRFCETLASRFRVDITLVEPGAEMDPTSVRDPRLGSIPVPGFRWMAEHGQYDSIIYCMGNSEEYAETYALLMRFYGVVWLQDIRLTGFYRDFFEREGRDLEKMPPEVAEWAQRYPEFADGLLLRDVGTQHEHGIYLAGEVLAHASRVVVNSRLAAELAGLEGKRAVPVISLPMAAPYPFDKPGGLRRDLLKARALPPTAKVVLVTGDIDERFGIAVLMEAMSSPQLSDAVLVFAGRLAPGVSETILNAAAAAGLDNRFAIDTDPTETDRWLGVAECAVHVVFPTNGESSYGVCRCLAAGVPTIVNDHGAFRELPGDAVFRVSPQPQPGELAGALLTVLSNEDVRATLSQAALIYAQDVSFESVADRFWREVILAS